MNILIDLINNPMLGFTNDHRYTILRGIGDLLRQQGHRVYLPEAWRSVHDEPDWEPYNEFSFLRIDFHIGRGAYNPRSTYNFHRGRGVPVATFCNGWLNSSMVVDRCGLFGDSFYHRTIGDILEATPEDARAELLRLSLIERNVSKRHQTRVDPIPCDDFIFVPGQALYDRSLVDHSETGLIDFIRTTVRAAAAAGLNVVYKPHPGLEDGVPRHGKRELEDAIRALDAENRNFFVVNTSIYDLTRAALFTACVNSGSIIDNVVTLTPVFCCGRSFFTHSGAVVYERDPERGLARMIAGGYDLPAMQARQRKLLWWLHTHLLLAEVAPEENLRRLERLCDVDLVRAHRS